MMEKVTLKNNIQMELRKAQIKDAKLIVDFYNEIGGETDFLSFGKNEFPNDVQAEEKAIEGITTQDTATMILALCGEEIAGIVTINSSMKRKMRRACELGIGIRQRYCNIGLGNIMMDRAINFAKENGVTKKISLITRSDNELAISLYKKLGFEIEGILKKESYENGRYYDSLYMGMFL